MKRIELTDSHHSLLLQIPPFDGYQATQAAHLAERLDFHVYSLEQGEVVARQGDPCKYLYVLLEGCLRVDIIDAFGTRILIEHIEAPRVFASPHLFGTENVLPATFTVLEDGVLFAATRESAFRLISEEPGILRKFLCITGNCNNCSSKRLRVLSFRGVRERLAVYLFDRIRPGEDVVKVVHNTSQLAEYLGVTRPALSKEIGKLKREGVIAVEDKLVRILNPCVLRQLVNY